MLGALREAHAAGADLGSRAPHIQAAGTTLSAMARALREAARQPFSAQPEPKLFCSEAEQHLLDLAGAIERLADLAAGFPDTEK